MTRRTQPNSVISTMKGKVINVRPGTMDQAIIDQMRSDPYGVRHIVKNGDVVVDGGANIGAFAAFVLMYAPRANLVCVEPLARNVELCRENLRKETTCVVHHAALMGKPGTVVLNDYGDDASACHSVLDYGAEESGKEEVSAITLEEIMTGQNIDRIDILKLDVQGAEFEIVELTPIRVLKRIGFITMEVHPSIFGPSGEIGRIANSSSMVQDLVRKLSKTHVLINGYPDSDSLATLSWKNRQEAAVLEKLISTLRLHAISLSLFAWQRLGLRYIISPRFRKIVRRMLRL